MHHKAHGQLLNNFGQAFCSIAVDNSSLLRCSSAKRFATSEEGEQFRTVIINVGQFVEVHMILDWGSFESEHKKMIYNG